MRVFKVLEQIASSVKIFFLCTGAILVSTAGSRPVCHIEYRWIHLTCIFQVESHLYCRLVLKKILFEISQNILRKEKLLDGTYIYTVTLDNHYFRFTNYRSLHCWHKVIGITLRWLNLIQDEILMRYQVNVLRDLYLGKKN